MTRNAPVADLAAVHVPTLVVVGAQGTLTPPGVARGMAAAIAGAELVVLRNAGHLSNIAQPAEFNRALESFLRRLPG
jgi:pimeloyl-ACP methyl ester carboxylesterase